jgi:YD repeat-containing protein
MGIDSLATFGREGEIRWGLHVRGKIHRWDWFEWGRLRNRHTYSHRSRSHNWSGKANNGKVRTMIMEPSSKVSLATDKQWDTSPCPKRQLTKKDTTARLS